MEQSKLQAAIERPTTQNNEVAGATGHPNVATTNNSVSTAPDTNAVEMARPIKRTPTSGFVKVLPPNHDLVKKGKKERSSGDLIIGDDQTFVCESGTELTAYISEYKDVYQAAYGWVNPDPKKPKEKRWDSLNEAQAAGAHDATRNCNVRLLLQQPEGVDVPEIFQLTLEGKKYADVFIWTYNGTDYRFGEALWDLFENVANLAELQDEVIGTGFKVEFKSEVNGQGAVRHWIEPTAIVDTPESVKSWQADKGFIAGNPAQKIAA